MEAICPRRRRRVDNFDHMLDCLPVTDQDLRGPHSIDFLIRFVAELKARTPYGIAPILDSPPTGLSISA